MQSIFLRVFIIAFCVVCGTNLTKLSRRKNKKGEHNQFWFAVCESMLPDSCTVKISPLHVSRRREARNLLHLREILYYISRIILAVRELISFKGLQSNWIYNQGQ